MRALYRATLAGIFRLLPPKVAVIAWFALSTLLTAAWAATAVYLAVKGTWGAAAFFGFFALLAGRGWVVEHILDFRSYGLTGMAEDVEQQRLHGRP